VVNRILAVLIALGLAACGSNGTTTPTPTGQLVIQDLVIGTGATAASGDTVTVDYVGTLTDGTVFDSSASHGQSFTFVLGAGQVIAGWDQGVPGMRVGGRRKLTVPPSLAYGNQQVGPIPPNSTLIFDITLDSIAGK
jgi:FKBP-type peptidyl-prolyl cis-trans isomerase